MGVLITRMLHPMNRMSTTAISVKNEYKKETCDRVCDHGKEL